MEIRCDYCGKVFNRRPSAIKKHNYCDKECRRNANNITAKCETCGNEVTRCKSQALNHVFCSRECAKEYLSNKMANMNVELNPGRMTIEVKSKLRENRLNKGNGKAYAKTYGRHTHRIVAEQLLGSPLQKGEVVHHIDGDIRNNDALNLKVFSSQAEHALWHKNEKLDPSENYE